MSISSISTATTLLATDLTTASTSNSATPEADTASETATTSRVDLPAVTITLSPEAQTALETSTSPTTAAATANADGAAEDTPFARNKDQFANIMTIMGDTTGKYSQDEQVAAYDALRTLGATHGLIGADAENTKLYQQVMSTSPIVQYVNDLHTQNYNAVTSAWNIATPETRGAAAATAMVNFYNGLSSPDQNAFFSININGAHSDGSRMYSSPDQWLSGILPFANQAALNPAKSDAQASLVDTLKALGASKPSTSADVALTVLQSAATADAADKTQADPSAKASSDTTPGLQSLIQKRYAIGDNAEVSA